MLYIDVDAMCKLAHWQILPLLPGLTGFAWENMGTLASLKFRASRAVKQLDERLFRSKEAAQIVEDCLGKMTPLPSPSPERLALFGDVAQIDAGEAVLMALTVDDPDGYFLTGDKRALKAVTKFEVAKNMVGRVLVLEQLFLMALQEMGRAWILEKVCPYRDLDKSIGVILGSRCDAGAKTIEEGVASFLREIRRYHNPSLLKE